jgi:hypothetical protein
MAAKILKYLSIALLSLVVFFLYVIIIRPKIHHKKNLSDLNNYIESFKAIEHPQNTSEIYYNAFFGNSTGSSNHCEHIIVQIRKYEPIEEQKIKDFYLKKHPEVFVRFIKSLEDCCGEKEHGYKILCFQLFADNQPVLNNQNYQTILPVYVLEYWVDGTYLSDKLCN